MEYELTNEETLKLDEYWEFINVFYNNIDKDNEFQFVSDYRETIIKKINTKYSAEEFYFFEKMLNKMLWKLLTIYDIKVYRINFKIKEGFIINCDRSYTNKQVMFIDNRMILYPNYGDVTSNENYPENLFKILNILSKREIYEKVINDKNYIENIKIEKYYYPHDYPFPNISLIEFNNNDKEIWLKRINAYYYSNNESNVDSNVDSNWYKLIL